MYECQMFSNGMIIFMGPLKKDTKKVKKVSLTIKGSPFWHSARFRL